jgi:hypothetical protein
MPDTGWKSEDIDLSGGNVYVLDFIVFTAPNQ